MVQRTCHFMCEISFYHFTSIRLWFIMTLVTCQNNFICKPLLVCELLIGKVHKHGHIHTHIHMHAHINVFDSIFLGWLCIKSYLIFPCLVFKCRGQFRFGDPGQNTGTLHSISETTTTTRTISRPRNAASGRWSAAQGLWRSGGEVIVTGYPNVNKFVWLQCTPTAACKL